MWDKILSFKRLFFEKIRTIFKNDLRFSKIFKIDSTFFCLFSHVD